ncbi:MAG: transporter substrate-binding domain-containing protein, partial [Bacteroidota bacterium]
TGTEEYLKQHFFKKVVPYDGLTEGLNGLLNDEVDAFLYDEPILKHRIANEMAYQTIEVLPIRFDLQFYAFAFSDEHAALNKAVSQKILAFTESMEWRLLLAEYDLTEL